MYSVVEYDEKYKFEVIELWKQVCIQEFGFVEWTEAMSNVEADSFERFLVLLHKGKVIATMAYRDIGNGIAEIKRVYMYKEHRGCGMSQVMLDLIIEDTLNKGYEKIFIETWKQFQRGVGFYLKNDFKLVEEDGNCIRYERYIG